MGKFIALRKTPRSQTLGLAALSFPDRRSHIAKSALVSEHSEVLESIGLTPARLSHPNDNPVNCFERLGYLGAYVIETRSEDASEKAREQLASDFYIVPDVQLSLPRAALARKYLRRPRKRPYWPKESGVNLAHHDGIAGQGVLVGVLDTGCDADHVELRSKRIEFRYVPLSPLYSPLRATRGFDVDGHGTHVSGIIAGRNVGVAPDVELMVASVIESETMKTSLERIVVALDWMLSQFQRDDNLAKPMIINMSLGFRPESMAKSELEPIVNGMKLILSTLAEDFDVLPVVAIGNDGPGTMRAPGYFPETLSVGAVDFDLQPAHFSGGGVSPITGQTEPDIAGFGVGILSSLERDIDKHNVYARMSGTSMAAPYVTGIAALLASADPSMHGEAIRQRLIDDAMPLSAPPTRVGAGLARYK
jgi:subtilisin family serine protease